MTGNEAAELYDWLRENLEIEVEYVDSGGRNSVYIQLKFRGEKNAFSSAVISIPDSP